VVNSFLLSVKFESKQKNIKILIGFCKMGISKKKTLKRLNPDQLAVIVERFSLFCCKVERVR